MKKNKYISIIIVIIAIIIVSIVVISIIFTNTSIIATKTTMEIVEVIPTISDRYEYTIFIVYDEEGNKYTLPKIDSKYVRRYHEGDMLPVIIYTYKNGFTEINANKEFLDTPYNI